MPYFNLHVRVPLRVPGVSQPGRLTSQGFGPLLINIYPPSVQAGLISMKPQPIHYVCSDGAQADTSSSHGQLVFFRRVL